MKTHNNGKGPLVHFNFLNLNVVFRFVKLENVVVVSGARSKRRVKPFYEIIILAGDKVFSFYLK